MLLAAVGHLGYIVHEDRCVARDAGDHVATPDRVSRWKDQQLPLAKLGFRFGDFRRAAQAVTAMRQVLPSGLQ